MYKKELHGKVQHSEELRGIHLGHKTDVAIVEQLETAERLYFGRICARLKV